MKEISDGSVDMVLTDLPYGTTQNKWDCLIDLPALWAQWKRVCRPGAPICLFAQQPFSTTLCASNLSQLRTEWVWTGKQPTGFLNCNRYPMKATESIFVFCDRTPPYHPQMKHGAKPYVTGKNRGSSNYGKFKEVRTENSGTRYPSTVLEFPRDKTRLHPTAKPVALCEYLIRTYTEEGMTVLDCTMGSGSTGVAALNEGRHFVGIERDPAYFAIAEERIAAAQQPALQEAA